LTFIYIPQNQTIHWLTVWYPRPFDTSRTFKITVITFANDGSDHSGDCCLAVAKMMAIISWRRWWPRW